MNPLTTIAALALAAFGLMTWACWRARRRALHVEKPRDWRETWCVPECYAAHDQEGPCEDCPARRHGATRADSRAARQAND